MESYMLTNGLPVLFFSDWKVLLKIRNISSPMRKRVLFIFKDKLIKFKQKESKGVRALKGSEYLPENIVTVKKEFEDMLRKFCLPKELTLSKLEEFLSESRKTSFVSSQMISFCKTFSGKDAFHIKEIPKLVIKSLSFDLLDLSTIGLVHSLKIALDQTPKTYNKLSKIKKVNKLKLNSFFNDLTELKWISTVKEFELSSSTITKQMKMPNLKKIRISGCSEGISKLECPRLETLNSYIAESFQNEVGKFKNIRVLEFYGNNFSEVIRNLPSSLRTISTGSSVLSKEDGQIILKRCPNLIKLLDSFGSVFTIADLQGTKQIREIQIRSELNQEGQSKLKLRRIEIDEHNYVLIEQYPEIISNCSNIKVKTDKLNLRYLPAIDAKIEFNSSSLLKQKEIDRYLDKFKKWHVKSVSVVKADCARKIIKVAKKVDEVQCAEDLEELRKEFESTQIKIERLYVTPEEKKEMRSTLFSKIFGC